MFKKINGSAGYGKTTALIQQVKDLYNHRSQEQNFVLITPTNKAAMVLNSRLAKESLPALAKTLHSTLYVWEATEDIKAIKKIRDIDPNTQKFRVDENGKPLYREEIEYFFIKRLKESVKGKIVLVDESSMVSSEVWHDLIDSEYFEEIYAYGDEKQLPPIEDYNKLELRYRPYYRFWHEFKDPENVTTLKINYRQQGDLKTFVETIENNLFSNLHSTRIPTPLYQGNNFSVHSTDIKEDELLEAIMTSDIIITPYNKVRQLVNNIRRKQQARIKKMPFSPLPVVGDKIIFVDAVKKETTQGKYTFKTIYLAKNVNAVITNISDISVTDNLMIADIIDETGKHHFNMSLSLNTIVGITTSSGVARIDYAYAVTVHSSQGGQWNNVLFLDGHWPGEDASKLRYVGITRAQQFLSIVCGIMNTTESKDADRSIIIRLSQLVK